MTHSNDPRVTSLVENFVAGKIDRRQLIGRAAGLGVSATALGSVLSGSLGSLSASAQEGGKDFVASLSADIDTLDPHVSQLLIYGNSIRFNVFSSLVRYSPSLEYLPDLAESWENPDEKTYRFTMREGATYHDGQAVEASHVEFSFQRIAELETVFSSRVANIASYNVIDARTIEIVLNDVQADFIDGLILLSIISPEIAETVAENPIGTGPFKFVEWSTNDHISLAKNENYFEEGVPAVDTLRFNIIPEAQAAIANLESGAIHGVVDVPVAQAAALEGSDAVTPIIVPTSSIHMFELLGKNNEAIRTDVRVRQAIAHCLDKEAIKTIVFSGQGRPKWSWVPGDSWAFKDHEGYPYDTARAKELLEEAGVTDLEFTVLAITGYGDGERAATIWQQGLAEAGVTLNIEVQELSVWLDNYINHTYDVIWNVFPGFADPNYFVSFGLQPHLADGWTNGTAADLAVRSNQVLDQAERTELYHQLQDLFVEELPVLIIQEAPQASVTAPNVTGWEINPLGSVLLRNVDITE